MTYKDIPGWFDFEDVYREAVARGQDGDHFVELGVYFGRSTCFMGEQIRDSGKLIVFDAIDFFMDRWIEPPEHRALIKQHGSQLNVCMHFLREADVEPFINIVPLESAAAANLYGNKSLDFIWNDAGHHYADVRRNILSWYPKLKPTGTFGGHDFAGDEMSHEVERAVRECFKLPPEVTPLHLPHSWLLRPQEEPWRSLLAS